MKPYISIRAIAAAAVVLFSGMTACTREYRENPDPQPPSNTAAVTVTVTIPGAQIPVSRSISGTGGEAAVDRIDIFVFGPGGSSSDPEVLTEHVQGEQIAVSPSGNNAFEVTFKASLTQNATASTLVILANTPGDVIQSAKGTGTGKHQVLEALQYKSTNGTTDPEGWKWNANPDNTADPVCGSDFTPIPMYGEKALSGGVQAGMTIDNVDMIRMLARIDLLNGATDDFTLEEVFLVNYNTAGYIAPAWNTLDGKLLPALPDDPLIPATANQRIGEAHKICYTYAHNDGAGLDGEIYTYEAMKACGEPNDASRTDAVCLVVKGTLARDGKEYYYRIDFTDATSSANPVEVCYMPLYRNHRYRITIAAVEGIGHDSFDQALQSLGVSSNMMTSLLVVDETGIKDIVWNNHYYLGVGDPLEMDADGGNGEIKVSTNYPSGWQIDTEKGSGGFDYIDGPTGWILQAVPTTGKMALQIDVNPDTDNSRTAWIYVKAGSLRHKVIVVQLPGTSKAAGEANSYIVVPGEEILIPVSRANEGWPGSIAAGDALTGELVWTDNRLGVDPASNIAKVETEGSGPEGYVRVTAGSAEGNAVVCVKVGNVIKWSWHIWVTHDRDVIEAGHPGNTNWMDRNLGSFGNAFTTWDDTRIWGVVFQWGRKDPFPPSNNRYTASGGLMEWAKTPTVRSVENSIQIPYEWTSNQFTNFSGSNGATSWDNNGKTVWDPCPAGWRVPVSSYYSGMTIGNFTHSDYGRYSDAIGGYYIMVGSRQEDNGEGYVDAGGSSWVGTGWYWTATGGAGTTANALKFTSGQWGGGEVNVNSLRGKRYGKHIRCVRE